MNELITRVEELAIQAAGAQLQIDKSEAEARDLGRELGKARQKIMELVNERDHALARVPPEAWLEENKKLADRIERMEASEDIVRKSLNEEITNRDRELREMDAEAKAHREALQAKDAEISKLLGAHADDIARIDKVTALLAVIESDATERGKEEGESLCEFLARQDAEIEKEGTRAFESGEALKAVRQELGDRTQKVIELSRWHEENLEKIKGLEAQLAHETERLKAAIRSDEIYAKECGRFDGESLRSFIGRIVGDNIHMRDELSAANQRMQIEKMKELEELVAAVIADRDRIRTELAAILAEANKSGRCNGDPVQLLKQGQADLDAMTYFENESAKLNALVSKLQGELATARDQAGVAQHECSIWNNAATRAGQTLTKLGKLQDENEAQFIERMQGAEFNREEQLKNALAAKNKAQSEDDESHRRFMNLIRMADSCGRLRGESVEQFVARQDQLRVSNMEQRDEARSEVERLSALVASLQVDLEDAKRKYGDIMAALGNETPLEFIDRMQITGKAQKAELAAKVEELKKQLAATRSAYSKTHSDLVYMERMVNERGQKLEAALATVANQSAAIAEAQRVTEKYTAACKAATKLKEWASTIRHKVLVAMVHTKAMAEYDTIMKELDGGKVPQ